MRRPFVRLLVVAVALVAGSGVCAPSRALADDPPAPPSAPAPEGEVRAAHAQIDAVLADMRATSRRVREQLRTTRLRGSRMQIACVDDALSRADVSLRAAKDAGDAAFVAYGRGDLEEARGARVRVAEWQKAQRSAARDSGFCAVSNAIPAAQQATTVTMSVDPKIPRVAP